MEKGTVDNNINSSKQNDEGLTQQKTRSNRKSSLDFRKYTKQIWLAGLGAFSRAEEEGNKLFDSLVKVGEELESKTVEVTDSTVVNISEKTKESVAEKKDKVEKILEQSISHPLNRIGLVTVKDIQHLESLLLQLHNKVDALVEENKNLREQQLKNDIKD